MNKYLFGIRFDNVDMHEALTRIDQCVINQQASAVFTPNVDHIVNIHCDHEFAETYSQADLVLNDSAVLLITSRLLKKPLQAKISGSDLFPELCALAAQKGYGVYFLGGRPGVVEAAAANLKAIHPDLYVAGLYSPSFGFENNPEECRWIVREIIACKPDILFVGVGSPKQEKWIAKHKDILQVPVAIAIGASFDFVAGSMPRAPQWMQQCGLEWLYRFCCEPKRLFARYFIHDLRFFRIAARELFNP